mmetsp:Transcript_2680/g.5982  ORF Transcript_2680/g.5982 Transcript_2680/m.5982 type:complete len:211 (-) Transcript_2680:1081-1713(-)
MPSAWPSTGIRVCFFTCSTRLFPPRGITKSIALSSCKSSLMASRPSTRPTMPRPTLPPLASNTASTTTLCSALFDLAASLPPLSRRPLPLRRAREAICGRLSGRLSKTIKSTPIGTVTWVRIRSWETSVRFSTFPTGSTMFASCSIPVARVSILAWVSLSRCWRALPTPLPACAAASTSIWLAAKISAEFARSASATARITWALSSVLSA